MFVFFVDGVFFGICCCFVVGSLLGFFGFGYDCFGCCGNCFDFVLWVGCGSYVNFVGGRYFCGFFWYWIVF